MYDYSKRFRHSATPETPPTTFEIVVESFLLVFIIGVLALVVLLGAGCGDNANAPEPDGGAPTIGEPPPPVCVVGQHRDGTGCVPDVDAGVPDAEQLGACVDVCPGEELTPWPTNPPEYMLCRPSYKRCAVPIVAPADARLGCAAACDSADAQWSPCADCAVVCGSDHVERCSSCPGGPLVCESGSICMPTPDCTEACAAAGDALSCPPGGNVCSCTHADGNSQTCIGAP